MCCCVVCLSFVSVVCVAVVCGVWTQSEGRGHCIFGNTVLDYLGILELILLSKHVMGI